MVLGLQIVVKLKISRERLHKTALIKPTKNDNKNHQL